MSDLAVCRDTGKAIGLLTVAELASALRVAPGTVYSMAARGDIPCCRIGRGRSLRFDLEVVLRVLGQQRKED